MVPAVSEVWRRQALHWNSWRDLIALCRRSPQIGHSNPSGQRQRKSASRHAASVPYCCSNSASLSPFWNCTELRATAIPLQTHWCSRFVLGRSQLRKPRNQEVFWARCSSSPYRCATQHRNTATPHQLGDRSLSLERLADLLTA